MLQGAISLKKEDLGEPEKDGKLLECGVEGDEFNTEQHPSKSAVIKAEPGTAKYAAKQQMLKKSKTQDLGKLIKD